MPLFSSPCWNVNIRPESHLVSTIKIDGLTAALISPRRYLTNFRRSERIPLNACQKPVYSSRYVILVAWSDFLEEFPSYTYQSFFT